VAKYFQNITQVEAVRGEKFESTSEKTGLGIQKNHKDGPKDQIIIERCAEVGKSIRRIKIEVGGDSWSHPKIILFKKLVDIDHQLRKISPCLHFID
jgi:hypothetical protein